MTKWKDLQNANPEPSILDAIAHAEEKDARNLQEFLKTWAGNYGLFGNPIPKKDDQ